MYYLMYGALTILKNAEVGRNVDVGPRKKKFAPSCTFLARCASFLHYWSWKSRILHVSCTIYLAIWKSCKFLVQIFARWKSCKFLAPLFLQDENLARFLHHFSCKMKILQVSCTQWLCKVKILQVSYTNVVLKFLQDFVTLTLLWNSFSS